MRTLIWYTCVVVSLVTVGTHAQSVEDALPAATASTLLTFDAITELAAVEPGPRLQSDSMGRLGAGRLNSTHAKAGARVGALVGAGVGVAWTVHSCRDSHCHVSAYIGTPILFSLIGTALGEAIGAALAQTHRWPHPHP